MSPRSPAQRGEVIAGKYVVEEVIGHGGVGIVVAAEHRALRCRVAIKLLRPELAYEKDVVQRFLREAHAAARLKSQHVARVMDAGSSESGVAYLVMELLEGRDFASVVKEQGPLPVADAVEYVVQACDAVAEAHALGIVHRDIKPANLFLTRRADGSPLVKVLDFGLSKAERTPSQPTLTKENHVMGSPHFMSPEQMRSSREADVRSDVWSLGVVLYTLLAGRVPFDGTYLTEVCAAVLSGKPPPLSALRPAVPPELAAVVDRCLRVEPDERFQQVADLALALAPFRGAAAAPPASSRSPVTVSPVVAAAASPTPRSARWKWLALGGAAVLAVALSLALGTRPSPPLATAQPLLVIAAPPSEPTATPSTSAVPLVPRPTAPASPPRRTTGATPRRAVSAAAPATAPTKPKGEDDVILALPH